MYETRKEQVLPRRRFARRLATHAAAASGLLAVSLAIGMVGYVEFEHLSWVDAFLNASMLLGGMGPVDPPKTTGGKLFAGFYALYAGLVFIVAISVAAAPAVHRILHKFHWDSS